MNTSSIEREVAVYDDLQRACDARRDLLDAGYRPSELTLMDAPTARLTRGFDGPPIPEAIGGAIPSTSSLCRSSPSGGSASSS